MDTEKLKKFLEDITKLRFSTQKFIHASNLLNDFTPPHEMKPNMNYAISPSWFVCTTLKTVLNSQKYVQEYGKWPPRKNNNIMLMMEIFVYHLPSFELHFYERTKDKNGLFFNYLKDNGIANDLCEMRILEDRYLCLKQTLYDDSHYFDNATEEYLYLNFDLVECEFLGHRAVYVLDGYEFPHELCLNGNIDAISCVDGSQKTIYPLDQDSLQVFPNPLPLSQQQDPFFCQVWNGTYHYIFSNGQSDYGNVITTMKDKVISNLVIKDGYSVYAICKDDRYLYALINACHVWGDKTPSYLSILVINPENLVIIEEIQLDLKVSFDRIQIDIVAKYFVIEYGVLNVDVIETTIVMFLKGSTSDYRKLKESNVPIEDLSFTPVCYYSGLSFYMTRSSILFVYQTKDTSNMDGLQIFQVDLSRDRFMGNWKKLQYNLCFHFE